MAAFVAFQAYLPSATINVSVELERELIGLAVLTLTKYCLIYFNIQGNSGPCKIFATRLPVGFSDFNAIFSTISTKSAEFVASMCLFPEVFGDASLNIVSKY